MPTPYPDIDADGRMPSPLVDARIEETASGEKRCIIFDRVPDEDGRIDRWIAADEGWFVDLRDTR
ncbi:DUF7511 domain-containing protein [Natronomonas amylolytica]|uniref:DUF7511 domain-containing protein n=1 Tax=Natronomonas amylolytica TaxID=3108498 RepID=UPI00300B6209